MTDTPDFHQNIRDTYAARLSAARQHTPFGQIGPEDLAGIIRRTASLCGTTTAEVREAVQE